MMFSCSGNLATMACGLPYAIAAAVAYPDRQVVAFVGDGGFTMLMGELATCVKYNLDVKIVVIKNNTLGQIKWEQMVFLGNPEYRLRPAADRFRRRRARLAACRASPSTIRRSCGEVLRAGAGGRAGRCSSRRWSIRTSRRCRRRSTSRKPRNLAEALARGTPAAGSIARTIAANTVRELV